MWNRLTRMIPLLFGAMLLATPMASASETTPESIAGVTTIDAVAAKQLFDQGALFVDPRNDADWEAGRIPGAEHVELEAQLSEERLASLAGTDEPVVFYCNGENCRLSLTACEKAVAWGFKEVYWFRGGLPEWKDAGYPIE